METKAIEIKKKYIKENKLNKTGVIAIGEGKDGLYWFHVHDNEIIPDDCTIAIHPRR
jgi:hypothetical protein